MKRRAREVKIKGIDEIKTIDQFIELMRTNADIRDIVEKFPGDDADIGKVSQLLKCR